MLRTCAVLVMLLGSFTIHAADNTSSETPRKVAARATTELALIGTVSVQYNDIIDTNVRIKAVEVRNNRPSGVSGNLSIELWAFFDPFAGNGGQQGYKLGAVSLGTLAAGASIRNIDQTVPGLIIPPDGTYYSTFLLVEDSGGQTFFFDYVNFSGTVVYSGGKVNVSAPPRLSLPSSTATAKQNAPFSYTLDSSGALPQTFSATGLPTGLELKDAEITINESGIIYPVISGTPKKTGTFPVQIRATNEDGFDTFTLMLTVEASSQNVPPTINSLSATPNPALTRRRVAFSVSATDPENVAPIVSWDFKDGTTLSGATVFHTFTVAGKYDVQVSVGDGTNTVLQTISVDVTGATTSDPYVDLVTASSNPVAINSSVTLTATAFSPASEALAYTWNFGDGTPTATGNPVSHSYATKGEYTVSVTVQDVSLRLGNFSDFAMFVTDSSDQANLVAGVPSISPDGVQITVSPSPPGVLALDVAVVTPQGALSRAGFDFSTDFLIPGRAATLVSGDKPVSRVNRSGVVVATTTATDLSSSVSKFRGRKTIPVGAKDLGELPAVPDTLSDAQKIVSTAKLSGSFNFTSDKADKVSASFKIPLPAGYDLLRSQELSIGLSNIADRIVVDAKGKATGLADRGVLQKVKIKYPKGAGGVSLAGDVAQIDVTFSAPNLDRAGFESDGITPTGGGAKSLQVAIVLAGIPYSGTISAESKVSSKGDKAAVKLTR